MTLVLAIFRMLPLPVVLVAGLLAFYEGVPWLSDIPFVDRVPVVRTLIAGRVATESAKAAQAARTGYVQESRATAAEARAAEMQRQITGQQVVIDAYQIQYKNSLAREAAQDAATEKAIALNDQKRAIRSRRCDPLDGADIDFLR